MFKNIWSFLKFCWFLGFFPCKKCQDPETKRTTLIPSDGFFYIFRLSLSLTVLVILPQCLIQVYYPEMAKFSDFLEKINPTDTDNMAYITFIVMLYLMNCICVVNNWRMRTGLVTMQNHFADYCQSYNYSDNLSDKYGNLLRMNLIILGILLILASIGTAAGMVLFFLQSDSDLNWHISKIFSSRLLKIKSNTAIRNSKSNNDETPYLYCL